MGIRFAVIISHPIQHFSPFFRELARQPGVELRVFYCCDWGAIPYRDAGFNRTFAWDIPLLEGYDYEFLPIRHRPKKLGYWDVDNPQVAMQLSKFDPNFIWLHGYSHRTIWRAARWAKGRAALVHFGDSELVHPRSWLRRTAKRTILRRHFHRCAAFITIGDNNEKYYQYYGVPTSKMFRGAYPIDLTRFQNATSAAQSSGNDDIRQRFGIPIDAVLALHVGKLESRKRPEHFVRALHRAHQQHINAYGLLVGDGPMRREIELLIQELGLSDRVQISGFVNQLEMPLFLHAGDVLVSTSEIDAHPLVVTESMAVGLPIVASDRIGCIGPTDSARPGVNTLTFPFGDIDQLARQIGRLVQDPELRKQLGQASLEIVQTQDVSVTIDAVMRAIAHIKGN